MPLGRVSNRKYCSRNDVCKATGSPRTNNDNHKSNDRPFSQSAGCSKSNKHTRSSTSSSGTSLLAAVCWSRPCRDGFALEAHALRRKLGNLNVVDAFLWAKSGVRRTLSERICGELLHFNSFLQLAWVNRSRGALKDEPHNILLAYLSKFWQNRHGKLYTLNRQLLKPNHTNTKSPATSLLSRVRFKRSRESQYKPQSITI